MVHLSIGNEQIMEALRQIANSLHDLAAHSHFGLFDPFVGIGSNYTWVIVLTLLLLFALCCLKWRSMCRQLTLSRLGTAALVVFLFGCFVYTAGTLHNSPMNLLDALYIVPSSVMASLEMFLYHNNINELTAAAHADRLYMALFGLAHFLAALITSSFILRLIGMRLFYLVELWVKSYGHTEELYVFWGINPPSLTLAESVRRERRGASIVFVNTSVTEGDMEVSVRSVFDVIKIKREAHIRLENIRAMVVNTHANLAHVSTSYDSLHALLSRGAGLRTLSRLMHHAEKLHLFFLSDDEEANLDSLETVAQTAEREGTGAAGRLHIYCAARHSATTRRLEVEQFLKSDAAHLHFVDASRLAVFSLKNEPAYHPVRFVNIDRETATVSSPFRAVIVGFGQTGQEAFKFLYEFSAFVDKDGHKTPFHCTVIDRSADERAGLFYTQAPTLRTDDEAAKSLCFTSCAINSTAYWDTLTDEIAHGLNYVVIAIPDDRLAIETAARLCTLAPRLRPTDAPPLHVFVRCYKDEDYSRMHAVAESLRGRCDNVGITVFGHLEGIYCYDIICNERYLRMAKRYNYAYYRSQAPSDATKSEDDVWADGLKIDRTKADPVIWNIEDTERRRDQNFSNAFHAATKLHLLSRGDGLQAADYWAGKDLTREPHTPHYLHLAPADATRLVNVARCEHERWVAASRLQGWTLGKAKDDRRKRHTDLTAWADLRPDDTTSARLQTQAYDCDVVDTTLRIATEHIPS